MKKSRGDEVDQKSPSLSFSSFSYTLFTHSAFAFNSIEVSAFASSPSLHLIPCSPVSFLPLLRVMHHVSLAAMELTALLRRRWGGRKGRIKFDAGKKQEPKELKGREM